MTTARACSARRLGPVQRFALGLLIGLVPALAAGPGLAKTAPKAVPPPPDSPWTTPDAPSGTMTVSRLSQMILRIDRKAKRDGNLWELKVRKVPVTVIADPAADRMRIVVGIVEADKLTPKLMTRVMQANFDTALDARYALAHKVLWGTFIHPLGALTPEEFLAGLLQTVNLALTFGTSFSSGILTFGGGDSQDILQRELDESAKPKPDAPPPPGRKPN